MPSSVFTGAIYGTGTYGTAKYGSFGVIVSVDGVASSFVLNDTLQIEADATHVIDTPIEPALIGSVGSVTVQANSVATTVGVEGQSFAGTVTLIATTLITINTGVEATGSIDNLVVSGDGLVTPTLPLLQDQLLLYMTVPVISGDANVSLDSVEATGAVQTVSVFASSTVLSNSVSSTVSVGTISLETNNYLDVIGVQATSVAGSAFVAASATLTVTGVFSTGAIDSVVVLENEVQIPPSVLLSAVLGTLTVTTTSFNFNAVASQYSRNRTAYVPRKPTAKERTVIVPAGQ